ncbi:response regulator containing a CheY-like receiver domain and a GGDEF domain [Synechococcus sp. PCC 7502]|uniref:response regulator n=1 Tax=Synechococcus sp. PCC 7502 TaxID=1173263 RepID=UPI00029FF2BA|nr:response regulator [Synechococcus sp. PCC 7502]AFY74266.1 response regulator containing a CheY-like receiver domain and a GGDEF domain [Synechococcus sp. PCC 7502]
MAANKILVIDDSRVIRNMVRDMLPQESFEIIEAADGIKGLEAAKQNKPWLIILDFILPRMSGFEVYEQLQQDPVLSRTPLVIMSGRKEEVTSKIPEPFDDKYLVFVEKPIDQKELMAAIKKAVVLSRKRPPIGLVHDQTQTQITASGADPVLLSRVTALETKVKTLEQQLLSQHKQLQQLVNFIKQKLS